MTIFVGSTNPVKLNAVKVAISDEYPDAVIQGFEVQSQVNDQPMTDDETMIGSINRAKAALAAGLSQHNNSDVNEIVLGVGLEGGVLINDQDEMWSTVWAAVVDQQGNHYVANGARVRVPDVIAEPIRLGQEMGPVMQGLTGISDVRKKQGMFGVITKDFVSRTEEYGAIAKCALGLWYGRDWNAGLKNQISISKK